jgi:hypothetical protein
MTMTALNQTRGPVIVIFNPRLIVASSGLVLITAVKCAALYIVLASIMNEEKSLYKYRLGRLTRDDYCILGINIGVSRAHVIRRNNSTDLSWT